jgi:hypothetical protein
VGYRRQCKNMKKRREEERKVKIGRIYRDASVTQEIFTSEFLIDAKIAGPLWRMPRRVFFQAHYYYYDRLFVRPRMGKEDPKEMYASSQHSEHSGPLVAVV